MTDQDDQIKRLAEELAHLIEFVPASKTELKQWYDQAQRLQDKKDLLQDAPHFLWHYLSDADIRMKDESYAEIQNSRIALLIEHLRSGSMPSDEDTYLN